jgi:hypothetical protein
MSVIFAAKIVEEIFEPEDDSVYVCKTSDVEEHSGNLFRSEKKFPQSRVNVMIHAFLR